MRINATTFEEFFDNAGIHKDTLMRLDQMIMDIAPDIDRGLYDMGTMCGIGYAMLPYKTNMTLGGKWPVIGIAPQKTTANLYIMAVAADGQYLVEKYKDRLGKVSTGKSCVRIRKLDNVNLMELENLIREALAWHATKLHK